MPENNRYYLSTAPIWRALVHLCVPMIAGLSVGAVYSVINAGFVGSLHSTALLAALTFSLPVFALQMAVGGVFGVGGGTYVSRLLGVEERVDHSASTDPSTAAERIRRVTSFTTWASVAAGVVLAAIGLMLLPSLVALLGATGETTAPTMTYVGILLAFTPVLVSAFALEQLVRAEGAAMVSMYGLIAATITNLALDVVLILGLGWGVAGAAVAVGVSNLVMVGWYAWWLQRRSSAASLAPRWFTIDREMLRTVFGVGASELIMSSFLIVSSLVVMRLAIGYGDAAVAGIGVALRISQLVEMVCMGVFIGAMPVLAYAFGAANRGRLRAGIGGSALTIAAITGICTTIALLFHEQVLRVFSDDPAVLTDGATVLTAMLVATVFNGFTGLFLTVFQATDQVRNATIMATAQGVLLVPVLVVLNARFGLTGLLWSSTIAELLTFVLGAALFYSGRQALDGRLVAGAVTPEPSVA